MASCLDAKLANRTHPSLERAGKLRRCQCCKASVQLERCECCGALLFASAQVPYLCLKGSSAGSTKCVEARQSCFSQASCNRDPYIIHLNIALSMVVSFFLVEKAMFQMGKMHLLRSPVQLAKLRKPKGCAWLKAAAHHPSLNDTQASCTGTACAELAPKGHCVSGKSCRGTILWARRQKFAEPKRACHPGSRPASAETSSRNLVAGTTVSCLVICSASH